LTAAQKYATNLTDSTLPHNLGQIFHSEYPYNTEMTINITRLVKIKGANIALAHNYFGCLYLAIIRLIMANYVVILNP